MSRTATTMVGDRRAGTGATPVGGGVAPDWPDGARSCVCLAFDLDGPTSAARQGARIWEGVGPFLEGAYGPTRALPRLLDVLAAHDLPATFFVPAWVAETWPEHCRAITEGGHEVAGHGYRHENFHDLTVAAQDTVLGRSQEVFRSVFGAPATGFRAPSGDWHAETPRLLAEHGYTWSSSLRSHHVPFRLDAPDGTASLIELPVRVDLDDYAHLALTREPAFPPGGDRIPEYGVVVDNWRREFAGHHAIGGLFSTVWHPKVVGTPGRARALDVLLGEIAATPDVWLATGSQVARWAAGHELLTP